MDAIKQEYFGDSNIYDLFETSELNDDSDSEFGNDLADPLPKKP